MTGGPPVLARARGESGWILFDTLVGAVILTVGLLGASLVFNESNQSLELATARESAVTLATSLFSVASAYGCGSETGLSLPGAASPSGTGYPSTASIWEQCSSLYAGAAGARFPGALGDPAPVGTLPGGTSYAWSTAADGTAFDVSYRAVWTQGTADTDGCPATLGGGSAAVAPIGQNRTVTVEWLAQHQAHVMEDSAFGGVPTNSLVFSLPGAGGLLVTHMASGSMAQLAVEVSSFVAGGTGTVLVDRAASAGTGAPATGCAWFPFLPAHPAGSYALSYYLNGVPQGQPTATSPPGLSVDPGTITSWAA